MNDCASLGFLLLYVSSVFSVGDIEKGKTDKRELKILLRHMIIKERVFCTQLVELERIVFVRPVTVVQAVNLKSLLHLLMTPVRLMHVIFLSFGYVRLFPSELKMKQVLNISVSHLHEAEMSAESMIWYF